MTKPDHTEAERIAQLWVEENNCRTNGIRILAEAYLDALAQLREAGEVPRHDCEFTTNPEKGACDFHDRHADMLDALCGEDCTVWQLASQEKRWGRDGAITITIHIEEAS